MIIIKRYLASRELEFDAYPNDLRYSPSAYNFTTDKYHPAMIAAVRDKAGKIVAVHQTFLTSEGKKISGDGVKERLFSGTLKGGAIRLAHAQDKVVLCEGIEDSLSIIELCDDYPAWATGTASNIPDLPDSIKEVFLCFDNDDAGAAATKKAEKRYMDEGRDVTIFRLPNDCQDANAFLIKKKRLLKQPQKVVFP